MSVYILVVDDEPDVESLFRRRAVGVLAKAIDYALLGLELDNRLGQAA